MVADSKLEAEPCLKEMFGLDMPDMTAMMCVTQRLGGCIPGVLQKIMEFTFPTTAKALMTFWGVCSIVSRSRTRDLMRRTCRFTRSGRLSYYHHAGIEFDVRCSFCKHCGNYKYSQTINQRCFPRSGQQQTPKQLVELERLRRCMCHCGIHQEVEMEELTTRGLLERRAHSLWMKRTIPEIDVLCLLGGIP